jgi:hypothetical protein
MLFEAVIGCGSLDPCRLLADYVLACQPGHRRPLGEDPNPHPGSIAQASPPDTTCYTPSMIRLANLCVFKQCADDGHRTRVSSLGSRFDPST